MPSFQPPSPSRRFVLAGLSLLAGCASQPTPPPAPALHQAPPVPTTPVASSDWRDTPLAGGTWSYVPGDSISAARYGQAGAQAAVILRCDKASRQVALLRSGAGTELSLTTSAGTERRAAGRIDDGAVAMTGVVLSAFDPLLDRLIFSRGRFAIAAPGLPTLVVPAWAEPARAVEDCRK